VVVLVGAMIELHLLGKTIAGRRSDLIAFLREAIPFYERPGGIRVRILWCLEDPDRFVEIIQYDDAETYTLDQARAAHDPEMLGYLSRWRALLVEPPRVRTYQLAAWAE
jgi:hypothetical protein